MRVILLSLVYPLQYLLVCLVQGLRRFVQILAEVWWKAVLQRIQLAEYPSEPVQRLEKLLSAWDGMKFSHSISSFRQRLDHQILIVHPPSPHRHTRGRVDHPANVLSTVRCLFAFVM